MTHIRWRIVALLLAATIINFMDRVNLSFAAPLITQTFHVGPAAMGVVLSSFLWVYFLAQIPAGLAIDRFGARLLFGGGAGLWGIATLLTATATSIPALVGWRVVLGLGESPLSPASTKVLGIWVADSERGLAGAIGGIAGIPIGVFISAPILGWVITQYGWRAVFVVTGALAVIWAAVWTAYYRAPDEHPGANEAERAFLRANIRKKQASRSTEPFPWRQVLTDRNILGLCLGQMTLLFNLYFLLTWMPTFLVEQDHLTILRSGIYAAVPWIVGLVGVLVGGAGSDLLIRRGCGILLARKIVLASGMVLSMACLPAAFVTGVPAVLTFLSIAVFGVLLTSSVVWSSNAEVAPPQAAAGTAALQNFFGNAGGLAAPLLVGVLLQATGSWVAPMALAALVSLVGAGVYAAMLSDQHLARRRAAETLVAPTG